MTTLFCTDYNQIQYIMNRHPCIDCLCYNKQDLTSAPKVKQLFPNQLKVSKCTKKSPVHLSAYDLKQQFKNKVCLHLSLAEYSNLPIKKV